VRGSPFDGDCADGRGTDKLRSDDAAETAAEAAAAEIAAATAINAVRLLSAAAAILSPPTLVICVIGFANEEVDSLWLAKSLCTE